MRNWQRFDGGFFFRHQEKLLWLLNHPVLGPWFRYVLRIHGGHSKVGRNRVTRILPNAILWEEGGNRCIEVRTHPKFSKRICFAFLPAWRALHAWDTYIANRFVPAWNMGFDDFGPINPDAGSGSTTVDGYVQRNAQNASWSSVRDGAGTYADVSTVSSTFVRTVATTTTDQYERIARSFYTFDCGALSAGVSLLTAELRFRMDYLTNGFSSWDPDIGPYLATPAVKNNLASSDYGNVGNTPFCDAPLAYSDLTDETVETWALNSAGLGAISTALADDGIPAFSMRFADDAADIDPTWTSGANLQINIDSADQTGTADDPILFITYSSASFEQEGFQFGLDDAGEGSNTPVGAQDVDLTAPAEENRRLRVLTDVTGDPPSGQSTLQWRKVGDPDSEWRDV